jgi:hypothetical protein
MEIWLAVAVSGQHLPLVVQVCQGTLRALPAVTLGGDNVIASFYLQGWIWTLISSDFLMFFFGVCYRSLWPNFLGWKVIKAYQSQMSEVLSFRCDFPLILWINLAAWLFSPHPGCCTSFIRWRVLRYEHMIAELRGHGLMLDSDPRWWAVCSTWVAGSIEPQLQRKLELQGMWTMETLWQKRTLGLLEDIGSIQTKIRCSFDWSLQLQNVSASS